MDVYIYVCMHVHGYGYMRMYECIDVYMNECMDITV